MKSSAVTKLTDKLLLFLMEQEEAGKLELVSTPLNKAKEFAEEVCKKYKREFEETFPNFDKGYVYAQKLASRYGKTRRIEMPVLNRDDILDLQHRLMQGRIDLRPPYAQIIDKEGKPVTKDPLPDTLPKDIADAWVEKGLKDGDKEDDIVKVSIVKVPVKKLIPIQKQIYVDKSIESTAKFGYEKTVSFLGTALTISSKDYAIIDGHHRWLSACLLDFDLQIPCAVVDLDIVTLLKITKLYSFYFKGYEPNK